MTHTLNEGTALIVVDVQNDFCENGSLAVEGGAEVAALITTFLEGITYRLVIHTKDWHIKPADHFASSLDIEPDYVDHWPDHCIAETIGAELHENLVLPNNSVEFRKGEYEASYSGFDGMNFNNETLNEFLQKNNIEEVHIVGIALDYCVKATALDAAKLGYKTMVMHNLTASVNPDNDGETLKLLTDKNVLTLVDPTKL